MELYIKVTYLNTNKDRIRDEILINSLIPIVELLLDYVNSNCQENWKLILKNLKQVHQTTGQLEINKQDFADNFIELLKVIENLPWQLSKKMRANNLLEQYKEKLLIINNWLKKHPQASCIILDCWSNTAGYCEDSFYEKEIKLMPY